MSSTFGSDPVSRATNILSILSKKDALTIFLLAKEGLKAESQTPQLIGLTKKQYYTRLRQLVDAGLLRKNLDLYGYTTLGKLVHERQVLELLEQVKNLKQLSILDTLKNNTQFSDQEIAGFLGKIMDTNLETKQTEKGEVNWEYEQVISSLTRRIESSRTEITFVSRFYNEIIWRSLMHKANAGINVKLILDKTVSEQLNQGDSATVAIGYDNYEGERPNIGSSRMDIRVTNVPFSMLMIDGRDVGIQIVDANDPSVFVGYLLITDQQVCKSLASYCNNLWTKAEPFASVYGSSQFGQIVSKRSAVETI